MYFSHVRVADQLEWLCFCGELGGVAPGFRLGLCLLHMFQSEVQAEEAMNIWGMFFSCHLGRLAYELKVWLSLGVMAPSKIPECRLI